MNREDIIEMAKKCGWDNPANNMTPLYEFAELVARAEREECAKIAEIAEPYTCADLIRARGQS